MARIISLLLGLLGLSGGCTFAAAHPHLLLTTEKLHSLRAASQTTHHFLWERYLQDLPRMKATARGEEPVRDARYQGGLFPELAVAWLITGDPAPLALG